MSKKSLALLAIWVTTLIWGFGYLGVEDAIQGGWGTFPLIFARFGIAGLCLIPFSIKQKWWKNWPLVKDALINAIFLFMAYITQTIGQSQTSIANTSFLTVMWVVFIPIILFIITKRRLKVKNYIGVGLAMVGAFILCFGKDFSSFQVNIGDIYVIFTAIFFAIQIVHLDFVMKNHNALAVTNVQLLAVSLLALVVILLTRDFSSFGNGGYVGLLYAAIFSSALGFWLQAYGQKYISPTKAALIFSLESVIATIAAAIFYEEVITWNVIVGGLLMLAATIIVQIKFRKTTAK
jgi:drug/metabolite transporter (DMT)-like permease